MERIKKIWIAFLALLPIGATAVPFLLGAGLVAVPIIGASIYRSVVPVDLAEAISFFSSCWTCQLFSDIMATMSSLLPQVYRAIGKIVVPVGYALTAIWIAWRLISDFSHAKQENQWNLVGAFGGHAVKLAVMTALLLAPLPRMLTSIVIEPIFNIGLAMNRAMTDQTQFDECLVATAVTDPVAASPVAASSGAYSPHLRHNLTCELANVHNITGIGMATGWTMLNMAFNDNYQHKIVFGVPIFPNIPMICVGILLIILFLFALLPVPLYFLEVFIKLSMDLIMMPLMLLAWVFNNGWIFPNSKKNLKTVIDDVIKATVGIAMVGIFVTFAIMFLNSMFGSWNGAVVLRTAIEKNDSFYLIDGLMLRNDSLITIIMMGIFIAMFMMMIPNLVKALFKIEISQDFYNTAKSNLKTSWETLKKWYEDIKK